MLTEGTYSRQSKVERKMQIVNMNMSCCGSDGRGSAGSQSVCPVMGSPVDEKEAEAKGLVREYAGKKYYFCCAGCPEKFDKDPKRYA
jgi:YHS domain-containing protein